MMRAERHIEIRFWIDLIGACLEIFLIALNAAWISNGNWYSSIALGVCVLILIYFTFKLSEDVIQLEELSAEVK